MEDWEEERGRRSPGALRPLKDTDKEPMYCRKCLRFLDRAQKIPKLLSSKSVLCLNCITAEMSKDQEMLCHGCPECRDPTKPIPACAFQDPSRPSSSDPLSHTGPALWNTSTVDDAHHFNSTIAGTIQMLQSDLNRLAERKRNFNTRAMAAAYKLTSRLEADLSSPPPIWPSTPAVSPLPADAIAHLERLNMLHTSALLHCRLDDLVVSAGGLLDYEMMRLAMLGINKPEALRGPLDQSELNPMLFLANYCTAQGFIRTCRQESDESEPGAPPLLQMPSSFPHFYFDLEVDGLVFGRIIIEVRTDVAPLMARNFTALSTGELGIGYRGCTIFRCWENESVITGDFEQNNGSGGRSVFEKGFFMPDESKLVAERGAVGMRRCQKRCNQLGLVGSQFRILLQETLGFTAIFGRVVEGIELVEQLSCTGNSAGKPIITILIANCGKLN